MTLTKGNVSNIWLGTDHAFSLANNEGSSAWKKISADMDTNPHLFSTKLDGDCYAWIKRLGGYSPVIHLQQTNGNNSLHLPFTDEQNKEGIITGAKILKALKKSYDDCSEQAGFPARSDKIFCLIEY